MAGKKVLIVEDERDIAAVLGSIVLKLASAVVTAADGVEGLELARREKPDLILLDMKMPGMNGVEVLQELQADPATAAIPVLILTNTNFDPATKKLCEEAPNVKAFLPKTAGAKRLSEEIALRLGRS